MWEHKGKEGYITITVCLGPDWTPIQEFVIPKAEDREALRQSITQTAHEIGVPLEYFDPEVWRLEFRVAKAGKKYPYLDRNYHETVKRAWVRAEEGTRQEYYDTFQLLRLQEAQSLSRKAADPKKSEQSDLTGETKQPGRTMQKEEPLEPISWKMVAPGAVTQELAKRSRSLYRQIVLAAQSGNVDRLSKMQEYGYFITHCALSQKGLSRAEANTLATSIAQLYAHAPTLDIVAALNKAGCPRDGNEVVGAAARGKLDHVRWLCEHACGICKPDAVSYASTEEIVDYLLSIEGYRTEEACEAAVRQGKLARLQYLRSRDPPCPWDWSKCHKAAKWWCRSGKQMMLEWISAQPA